MQAFRGTKLFDTFEVVKYLESVGAKFGACQNAYTSFDETVYEQVRTCLCAVMVLFMFACVACLHCPCQEDGERDVHARVSLQQLSQA